MHTPVAHDWTSRPAKFVAVFVLGGASIFGLAWSVATRSPAAARAGVPVAPPPANTGVSAAPALPPSIARKINLNTASATELELLPGIGPATARRIVADRESRGRFRSVNDLERVSGIGPRTVERLRDKVSVD